MSTDGESAASVEGETNTFGRTSHRKYFSLASKFDFLCSCNSDSLLLGPNVVWPFDSCVVASFQALRGVESRLYNLTSLSHNVLLDGYSIITFRRHRVAVYKVFLIRRMLNAACDCYAASSDKTLHALAKALRMLLHISDTSISSLETSPCVSFSEMWNKASLQCELLSTLFVTLAPAEVVNAHLLTNDFQKSKEHRIITDYLAPGMWEKSTLVEWEMLKSLLRQLESHQLLSAPPPETLTALSLQQLTCSMKVATLSYLLREAAIPMMRQVESVLFLFNPPVGIRVSSHDLLPAESLFDTELSQNIFVVLRKVIEWAAKRTSVTTKWISYQAMFMSGVSFPLHASSAIVNDKARVMSQRMFGELVDKNLNIVKSWINSSAFVHPLLDRVCDVEMSSEYVAEDESVATSDNASTVAEEEAVPNSIEPDEHELPQSSTIPNDQDFVMTDGIIPRAIPRSDIDAAKQYLLEKYSSLSKPLEEREALAKWRQNHVNYLRQKQEALKGKLYDELDALKDESKLRDVDAGDGISSITSSTYTRSGHLPHHNRILQAPGGTSTFSLAHEVETRVCSDKVGSDVIEIKEMKKEKAHKSNEVLDTMYHDAGSLNDILLEDDKSYVDETASIISAATGHSGDISEASEEVNAASATSVSTFEEIRDDTPKEQQPNDEVMQSDIGASRIQDEQPNDEVMQSDIGASRIQDEQPDDEVMQSDIGVSRIQDEQPDDEVMQSDIGASRIQDEIFQRLQETVANELGPAIANEAEGFTVMKSFPHAFSLLCKKFNVYNPFELLSEFTTDDLSIVSAPFSAIMHHNLASALKAQCLMIDQMLLSYALQDMKLLQHIDFVQKLFLLSDKSDFVMVFVSDLVDSYFESAASRVVSGTYSKRLGTNDKFFASNIWNRRYVETCFIRSTAQCNFIADDAMKYVELRVMESPSGMTTGKVNVLNGAYEMTDVSNISVNYTPLWPLDQVFSSSFVLLANRVQHRLLHLNQLMALSRHVWREMKQARSKAPTDMQDLRDRNMYFGYRQVRQCLQVLVDYTANRIRHSYYELQRRMMHCLRGGYGAIVMLLQEYMKDLAHAVLVCEYVPISEWTNDHPPLFEKFPLKSMRSTWKGLASVVESLIGSCRENLLVLHRMCRENCDDDMNELTKYISRLKSKIVVTGVTAKDIEVSCRSHADVLLMLLQSITVVA